jgi:DNA-binding GntR family transcriptional regulator
MVHCSAMGATAGTLNAQDAIAPQVVRLLRDAIIRAELVPGSAISEADIARRFGVSRQPVREAFIKLREMGLLEIRPQRGTLIRRISAREVMNARFVREAVEVAVVREAAAEQPAGLIDDLRGQIVAQKALAAADDGPGFLLLDERFHRTLAESIGRGFAWTVLESIKAQMDRVRFLSVAGATPLRELVRQHGAVVDGIAAGDPDRAERAMRTHLREILSSLPRIAAAHPDYFEAEEPQPPRSAAA